MKNNEDEIEEEQTLEEKIEYQKDMIESLKHFIQDLEEDLARLIETSTNEKDI